LLTDFRETALFSFESMDLSVFRKPPDLRSVSL
jgi:hypothetical protein